MNYQTVPQNAVSNIAVAPSHSSTTHYEETVYHNSITKFSTNNQRLHCEDKTLLVSSDVQLPVTANIYIGF